ncbi:fibronectin type III domain-containing protein [Streptacidiphilus sp. EB129]|uniref:fibronectin type III domain-containing protein n=1 Tax=Streptacidiphilus sp. EB129 TaxID=3156262 RepID=UPI0035185459
MTSALAAASIGGAALPAHGAVAAPGFVQQVSVHHHDGAASVSATPSAPVTAGDRLVVAVTVWSATSATAARVSDTAGNTYTELAHVVGSDNTELSVWSAPVTAGGGTRPTVTASTTSGGDLGLTALEYSGLSAATDASVLDVHAQATGTTSGADQVASGATPAATGSNELALGFYADSGFGDTLGAGSGFTQRVNVSPTSDVEFLGEDQTVQAGATPDAGFGTGGGTVWLATTVVLKSQAGGAPSAPGAPTITGVSPGDTRATLSWTAPPDDGSPITSYTVTPYAGGVAQPATLLTGSPPATSTVVTGLTDGTGYTFTVGAANAVGSGPASAPSQPVTPSATANGVWGPLQNWPVVAVHSIVLDSGKLLQWDGWETPEPTEVYDPVAKTFTTVTAPSSIFCAGNAKLPDGRVLVAGGYGQTSTGKLGIVDTNIFDPASQTWSKVADMHQPRWYPDLTELADGRYVAISGNSSDSSTWSDTPEVYDPVRNTWTQLTSISTSQVHEEEYPFSYLAPNGKVFTIGPSEDVSYWLDANAQTWTPVGQSGLRNGSSVMYQPGKILYSGGAPSVTATTPSVAGAATIDLNAPNPVWKPIAPMNYARVYHTLTMLPDGRVLAVGGEPTSSQTQVTSGVLPAEIWDPATGQWTTIGPIATARNYHSTAVLQPDGTVLIAGGGHEESSSDPGQYSAQVYSPSYLFNGPRPTISSAAASAHYGDVQTVVTPDAASVSAVNLVSFGADTHQADMDQHFVPLSFTAGQAPGTLNVTMPQSGAYAPPGDYMLFIVTRNGVPSVAHTIHVSAPASGTGPSTPTGVTATPGDGSATVAWTASSDGGVPITSYTVTPSAGGVALPATTVTGNPAATSTRVTGLSDGTSYTFTVTATDANGTSPPSTASNTVTPSATAPTPAFVQQATTHLGSASSAAVSLGKPVTVGDRMVVEVGVWSSTSATTSAVTDSAGNTYTEFAHSTASDGTETSVWSAPLSAATGTPLTVSATASAPADIGVAALEYSGLSTAPGTGALDVQAHATGTTGSAAVNVSSGAPAAATAADGELALGFYADSGFGDTLGHGSGFTARAGVFPTGDMELYVEDAIAAAGTRPNAAFLTGAGTVWLAGVLVFRHA